ncbi:hypothetical protein RhiirA1_461070 [Rhizophagus irregularis]|uniref:Uncharacterized protein n=1 Tax=Rhizophagus irregularis TaxID=588596 RepID=A0A2N0RQ27_9GLOM|nr:hypothetical protein RhiirA1_461070 [Rhizophagus irregularis]CAB4488385.1 unnamed protein product [Rhizophagus irregularis]
MILKDIGPLTFLKKQKHSDYTILRTKVEKEWQGEGLKAYWEKLIKEYNVHNVDYDYESNDELSYIIRKLIRKNEVLQEDISELRNEILILNNRIDNLERIICGEKYNYPVYSVSEKFMGETKLDYEFIHDWYGKDIKIRPCRGGISDEHMFQNFQYDFFIIHT